LPTTYLSTTGRVVRCLSKNRRTVHRLRPAHPASYHCMPRASCLIPHTSRPHGTHASLIPWSHLARLIGNEASTPADTMSAASEAARRPSLISTSPLPPQRGVILVTMCRPLLAAWGVEEGQRGGRGAQWGCLGTYLPTHGRNVKLPRPAGRQLLWVAHHHHLCCSARAREAPSDAGRKVGSATGWKLGGLTGHTRLHGSHGLPTPRTSPYHHLTTTNPDSGPHHCAHPRWPSRVELMGGGAATGGNAVEHVPGAARLACC